MTKGVRRTAWALSLGVITFALASEAPATSQEKGPRPRSALPACIFVRASARPTVGGYNHWVFIDNNCDKPAACDVTTNINPNTMTVAVKPGTTAHVLTFRASPARKFVPYVTCTLVGAH